MKTICIFSAIFALLWTTGCGGGGSDTGGGLGSPDPDILGELAGFLFDAKDGSSVSGGRVVVYDPVTGGFHFKGQGPAGSHQVSGSPQQCPDEEVASTVTDDKGFYSVNVPADRILNVCFSKDDYILDTYFDVTVAEEETVALGDVKLIKSEFSGSGQITGSVVSASTPATPLQGARIGFRSGINNFSGEEVKFTLTDVSGVFQEDLGAGNYSIEVSLAGFETVQTHAIVFGGELTVVEQILLLESDQAQGVGELEGSVLDALTGDVLSSVNVSLRPGTNNFTGTVGFDDFTNASGRFALAPEAGYYTVEASFAQFNTSFFNAVVIFGQSSKNNNVALLPLQDDASEQITIVLTWAGPPADLDAVMDYELSFGAGTTFSGTVFAGFDLGDIGKVSGDFGSALSFPFVELLMDDRDGFGPETIIITNLDQSGIYTYKVRDSINGNTALISTQSKAKVQVYLGNRLVSSYQVPPNLREGISWIVFEIRDGKIVTINDAEQPVIN